MSKKVRQPEMAGHDTRFPPEAYGYSDDVTPEVVEKIRRERGVDTSKPRWKIIDAMGQIVSA